MNKALFSRLLLSHQLVAGASPLAVFRKYVGSSASASLAQPEPVATEDINTQAAPMLGQIRTDWTREEIQKVYDMPFMELIYTAAQIHRMHNDPSMVQRCTLMSIKTGGCPENCSYCSQSSAHSKTTGLKAEKLLDLDSVYEAALRAKANGSTRFCMGAAWRGPSQVGPRQFERVLEMVKQVRGLGMEVCTTLGMLTPEQARQLATAGVTAYNHNLDTSPEHYPKITSTRKYEDRLATLNTVREAGMSVCAGGILGLGETIGDRVGLLHVLATLPVHPESVPINSLVAVKGTPLEDSPPVEALDFARCVAVARVVMPRSVIRLSAGRLKMSVTDQAMCFLAGANSIFDGDKLLTTPNNDRDDDQLMFDQLGLKSRPAFLPYHNAGHVAATQAAPATCQARAAAEAAGAPAAAA